MPALAQPTGAQILNTILVSGDAGQLSSWTADKIDAYISDALVNVVTGEFTYASDLLTANGKVPASLTQADWNSATGAMVNGIAYQLLKLEFNGSAPISGENGGIRSDAYMRSDTRFFAEANRYWQELNIESKYFRRYINMTVESVTRNNLIAT